MTSIRKDLRTGRFWRHFTGAVLSAIGLAASITGILGLAFPDLFEHAGVIGPAAVVVVSLVYGGRKAWPRPIEQSYDLPDTTIRIVRGDLFDEPGHIVVGTCDTFDTEPPHIIARGSVQAQALDRLFGGDRVELDRLITESIESARVIATVEKPGKSDRYDIGTVAVLEHRPRKLFFLAYTTMSAENVAQGTTDGIWKSLLSLWDSVTVHANGEPVSIPVIGGGQARMKQILPAQDSIRFIALSFVLQARKTPICDELRIVVQPQDYDRLDRLELQAFLSSLVPS